MNIIKDWNNMNYKKYNKFMFGFWLLCSAIELVQAESNLTDVIKIALPEDNKVQLNDVFGHNEIKKNYPNARIGLYGHTHTAEFFYQGLSHDIHFGREMELSNEVSLINPGGIGLYYNLPQTFAVLDMNKQAIIDN